MIMFTLVQLYLDFFVQIDAEEVFIWKKNRTIQS